MSSKILVKLLFFAKSRECVGESEVDFEWTDKTSVSGQNLLDSILSSYPSLKPLKDCLVLAVNQEYVESHSQLHLKAGTTRDHFDGKRVLQLEYECYRPMAEKEMRKICQVIRQKWKVERIALLHRLGVVPVGEASVIAVISSIHRKEALEAVSFAIDSLKTSVPIWKKEVYDDGNAEWKANKECPWKHPEIK